VQVLFLTRDGQAIDFTSGERVVDLEPPAMGWSWPLASRLREVRMMRCWIVATTLAFLSLPLPAAHASDEVKGSLVIIGGALRYTDTSVWKEIVDRAGGAGARIAIFPTASSNPAVSGERISELFRKLGADPFVVPVAVRNTEVDYKTIVADPEWGAKIRAAGGVFFSGGSQARITQALLTPEGANTPILDAIWDVYRRGGVIAGTSAGAAIMSRTMFSHPQTVLRTLETGVRAGAEVDRGLGFLDAEWFVEQHCLVRGRFARALVAMQSQGIKYGVGVDEDTAVVVSGGTDMRVVGYKGVLVLDISKSTRDEEHTRFNIANARISYLDRGDSINLKTREITPAKLKSEESRIDPRAENFRPWWHKPIFSNDILGNAVISTVLGQVLVHKTGEATGLAFDGAETAGGNVDGFEFRLSRTPETHGWHTDDEGYDSFTVANVRLDVHPVSITTPQFSRIEPKRPAADVALTPVSTTSPTEPPRREAPVVKTASTKSTGSGGECGRGYAKYLRHHRCALWNGVGGEIHHAAQVLG